MKKLCVIFVVFSLFIFAGCGGSKSKNKEETPGPEETVTDDDGSNAADTEPSDEPDTEPTEEPDQDNGDTTPEPSDDDADTIPEQNDNDSDTDSIPSDNDDIEEPQPNLPECTPESEMPCIDSETWLIWSEKTEELNWNDAVTYCEELKEGGHDDWRLPGVDVLLTLLQNCELTPPLESLGCSNSSEEPRSKLGYDTVLWSSSSSYSSAALAANFSNGTTGSKNIDNTYEARCVRIWKENKKAACSNEIPQNADWNSVSVITQTWDWETAQWLPSTTTVFNNETSEAECRFACNSGYQWTETRCSAFPYYDSDSGFTWSSLAPDKISFDEAKSYCSKLNESGYSDWHLPTISELRTLVQNHSGAETGGLCLITDECLSHKDCYLASPQNGCSGYEEDLSGKYSKLGDIYFFWSSSEDPGDYPGSAWSLGFSRGNFIDYDKKQPFKVRCVRK